MYTKVILTQLQEKLYPTQDINMSTFVELHDLGHYGLQGKTANIFQNVPSRKTRQSSSMMNVRGQLPDPSKYYSLPIQTSFELFKFVKGKLRKAEKEQNLRALETNDVVNGSFLLCIIKKFSDSAVHSGSDYAESVRSLAGFRGFH